MHDNFVFPYAFASTRPAQPNHGQRLSQSATDIFVSWSNGQGFDFYVRPFRDMKAVADAGQTAVEHGQRVEAAESGAIPSAPGW
ncbi:DUF2252 family protein [Arthrobacter sp. LAPM80]|uniref:DUF2252 family protein n=1 Tax=Arthrobacter sp. LAPM80 TaxID=3141788 RepID=UPI00398AEA2A